MVWCFQHHLLKTKRGTSTRALSLSFSLVSSFFLSFFFFLKFTSAKNSDEYRYASERQYTSSWRKGWGRRGKRNQEPHFLVFFPRASFDSSFASVLVPSQLYTEQLHYQQESAGTGEEGARERRQKMTDTRHETRGGERQHNGARVQNTEEITHTQGRKRKESEGNTQRLYADQSFVFVSRSPHPLCAPDDSAAPEGSMPSSWLGTHSEDGAAETAARDAAYALS